MKSELKSLTVKAMDDAGRGLARIATLSSVDHDGDTYAKGAFGGQDGEQWVSILPAHDRKAMPLGKARVYEDGDAAYAELYLNLNTEAGRNWHQTLKFDLEKGRSVQEWSYGFGVVDFAMEHRDGKKVRVLKKLDIHEVSPVLRGAGKGTRTLTMKSHDDLGSRLETLINEISEIVVQAEMKTAQTDIDGSTMGDNEMALLVTLRDRISEIVDANEDEELAKALAEDFGLYDAFKH